MQPFDARITVYLHEGTEEINVNLLDLEKTFDCPICAAAGERCEISIKSLSDHMARHYLENKRYVEINALMQKQNEHRLPADAQKHKIISTSDLRGYDEYLRNHQPAPIIEQLSEEDMIRIAIEDSMLEAQPPAPTQSYQPRKRKDAV
jgi:hypothetical protein